MESAKKPERSEQKRTVSVEAVSNDPAVKDYSFFFDPNEPTGTVSEGIVDFVGLYEGDDEIS